MSSRANSRGAAAFTASLFIHGAIVVTLLVLPEQIKKSWQLVTMEVVQQETRPEPPPPPPEPEKEPAPDKPDAPKLVKNKRFNKPKPKPQPEPEPEPEAETAPPKEEAPPVFDLGDNTFAKTGPGAGWNLNRSEGNTKFAGVSKTPSKSVRDTKAKRETGNGEKGNGFNPVPAKNWSKRPEPAFDTTLAPPYPLAAKRAGIEGSVRLQVFIGHDGRVKKIRVIDEPGGGLGEAAKQFLAHKPWRPARDRQGNPVDTVIVWTFRFVLDG